MASSVSHENAYLAKWRKIRLINTAYSMKDLLSTFSLSVVIQSGQHGEEEGKGLSVFDAAWNYRQLASWFRGLEENRRIWLGMLLYWMRFNRVCSARTASGPSVPRQPIARSLFHLRRALWQVKCLPLFIHVADGGIGVTSPESKSRVSLQARLLCRWCLVLEVLFNSRCLLCQGFNSQIIDLLTIAK